MKGIKMLEFIKELKKQDEYYDVKDYRMMKAINAGNYKMSIQGSNSHYCTPRETLHPLLYFTMEIALLNKKGWLHITRSKVIKNFPRYRELLSYADGVNSEYPVFGYVPVGLINDLYLYLIAKK